MRNTDYFSGKKITVVGLARSGLSCANLLIDLGADVWVSDSNDDESVRLNLEKLFRRDIRVESGRHSRSFIEGRDLVVISPGVAKTSPVVSWAQESGIPIVSEIEVAWLLCPAKVIAITGSNGKTTVVTLAGKIIEAAGRRCHILGNIGEPFSGRVQSILPQDLVCLEVSSFQLEGIREFRPWIALVNNFSANHLDRHKDIEEYLEAKKRIFMNQDSSDYLVLNQDEPCLAGLAKEAKSKVVYFKKHDGLNPNYCACLALAAILGIDKELCLSVFRDFKGVEHRQEFVAEINNVRFVNDSKATTVESTIWALENNAGQVILICGGRDKGLDYSVMLRQKAKVREAVLIGEARQKIKEAFGKNILVNEADTLEEAVRLAFSRSRPGDTVLLSPMCSSFDMFSDYEQRGRFFKEIVRKIGRENGP